ncbi:MAG: hypothetical protein RR202_07200 [Bacteroidales bacterium]
MKKIIALCTGCLLTLLLTGCWGGYYNEVSGGVGFVTFVANDPATVDVTIDGVRFFRAKVRDVSRPNQYAPKYDLRPGRRNIRVQWNGRTIYKRTIHIRPNQTTTIFLR